ncbi:MAG: hypothetical protein MI974_12835 [Chitinophagales bacterium]|nr:hypothetical protein [Chitinophagales bacterium]
MGWTRLIRQVAKNFQERTKKATSRHTAKAQGKSKSEETLHSQPRDKTNATDGMSKQAKEKALREGQNLKKEGLTTKERYQAPDNTQTGDNVTYRSREIAREKPVYDPEIQPSPTPAVSKGKTAGREL